MTKRLTKEQLIEWGVTNVYWDADLSDWIVRKHAYNKRKKRDLELNATKTTVVGKHKYTKDKKYYAYCWYDGADKHTVSAARLIYAWFYNVVPEGMDVEHIDNDSFNNELSNLTLSTRPDNLRKRYLDNPNNNHNQYM